MGRTKILIIEDDKTCARMLTHALENQGYEISAIVSTGKAAIDFVSKEIPDLILSDINIDGKINGIDAVTEIQKNYDIPVIYITGHNDILYRKKAEMTSPKGYLVKPFHLIELYSIVGNVFPMACVS